MPYPLAVVGFTLREATVTSTLFVQDLRSYTIYGENGALRYANTPLHIEAVRKFYVV